MCVCFPVAGVAVYRSCSVWLRFVGHSDFDSMNPADCSVKPGEA